MAEHILISSSSRSDAAGGDVERLSNFIGGRWVSSSTTEYLDVHNPARGVVIGRVPLSTGGDVDAAVAAATKAYAGWKETPPVTRARTMFRFKQLLEEHFDELARMVTIEHGAQCRLRDRQAENDLVSDTLQPPHTHYLKRGDLATSRLLRNAEPMEQQTEQRTEHGIEHGIEQGIELGALRGAFDVTDDIAYLNTAGMSPLLHDVRAAGERAVAMRAAPWTITADDWFDGVEQLRGQAAQLVGASADGIALVPATSYGLAVAARNLRAAPGTRVLLLDGEFPSSNYTWTRFSARTGAELVPVTRTDEQSWAEAVLAALDERTAVVVVPNVHWTNGDLVDLEPIAAAARHHGAAFVVEGSQSVGAMPLDVARLRPDFLVSVGYKWLLGPFGVGYLYVAEQHRDGEPLEENWISRAGSDDFGLDYNPRYLPGARRFDVGERTQFELVPMAIAALGQLLDWGVPAVSTALAGVTAAISERVRALGLPVQPAAARGPHLLGIELPVGSTKALAAALDEYGVVASLRRTTLRVAPHLHNSPTDIDRLVQALRAL